MRLCGCLEWRDRELASLSGGECQLVAVARVLAQGARILLLDEALSRMDLHHQAAIGRKHAGLCREQGYAVVLVAHDLNLASAWANAGLLLEHGRVLAHGPIAEVLNETSLARLYPGAPLRVTPGPHVHFQS
jgi:iron complex transport system ATP-binding protein